MQTDAVNIVKFMMICLIGVYVIVVASVHVNLKKYEIILEGGKKEIVKINLTGLCQYAIKYKYF